MHYLNSYYHLPDARALTVSRLNYVVPVVMHSGLILGLGVFIELRHQACKH